VNAKETIVALAAALGATIAGGCRSEPAPPSRPANVAPAPVASGARGDGGDDARAAVPTLDSLVALGSTLAPGMREVTRGEGPLPATIPLERSPSDTCVRAVLAGSAGVVGALKSGERTLALSEAGPLVPLGREGPVCLMKDREARVEIQGPAGSARYVVWMSP
jgi:hypothetical protein